MVFLSRLHSGVALEGIRASHHLAFQRPSTVHHAEQHRLGQMVVAIGVVGRGFHGLLEEDDCLRILDVVEVLETPTDDRIVKWALSGAGC